MLLKFRQSFYKWLRDSIINDDCGEVGSEDKPKRKTSSIRPLSFRSPSSDNQEIEVDGIYFKVIRGSGGIAIETKQYDPKTDRYVTLLHIIPEDAELGEELSKIIMLQSLRYS